MSRAGKRLPWGAISQGKVGTPALVAVVTRRKDWQILRERHWYRIPVDKAPEGLNRVRFLAFYQTAVFGGEKWSVNYYAAVKGMKRVLRCAILPEESGHPRAHQYYYQIMVDELRQLPRSIPSRRRRRIVFIPTTWERLMRAEEINDLYWTSPIEEKLYRALQRIGLEPERQIYVGGKTTGYFLDLVLFCRDGALDVECDGASYHSGLARAEADRNRDNYLTVAGWRILRFSGKEIRRNTADCLRLIKEMVAKLGGQDRAYSDSSTSS